MIIPEPTLKNLLKTATGLIAGFILTAASTVFIKSDTKKNTKTKKNIDDAATAEINEELQKVKEELQITREEMQTSQEELKPKMKSYNQPMKSCNQPTKSLLHPKEKCKALTKNCIL